MGRAWALSFSLALLCSCSYRPARFIDRPPAEKVVDDRPIAMPRRTPFVEAVHLSDVYLRRPIVDALDAERFPDARDVNSLDEVPRSSWYSPGPLDPAQFERSYAVSGRPRTPTRVEADGNGFRLVDSRGEVYALVSEPQNRPATLTSAGVIASRLTRAAGYRAAEAWVVDRAELGVRPDVGPPGRRWLAVRWPLGVDLGPTDMTRQRDDDPNDRIPHRDRRTLRALGVLAAWLDLGELGPRHLRDVYVGLPGRGHVQHFLVHLHDSLGTRALFPAAESTSAVGVVRGKPLTNLLTLGLTKPSAKAASRFESLLSFSRDGAAGYALAEPYEPVDRLLPADGYWIAKRLNSISDDVIDDAIAEAHFPEPKVARHVRAALFERRRQLIRECFSRVSPIELEGITGRQIDLRDEATLAGIAVAEQSRYQVRVLDDTGAEITPAFRVRSLIGEIRVTLPALERDYVVVRITAERAGEAAPRAFEIHLRQDDGTPRLVGARH